MLLQPSEYHTLQAFHTKERMLPISADCLKKAALNLISSPRPMIWLPCQPTAPSSSNHEPLNLSHWIPPLKHQSGTDLSLLSEALSSICIMTVSSLTPRCQPRILRRNKFPTHQKPRSKSKFLGKVIKHC